MNFCQACDELSMFVVTDEHGKLYLCDYCYVADCQRRILEFDHSVVNVQVILRKQCRICKTLHRTEVEAAKFERWRAGTPIQEVWPEKTADERELMMSGCCCFDKIFGVKK